MIFLKNGLWLSIPTTIVLSLIDSDIPAGGEMLYVVFFAFASGFPWNLITIIFWIGAAMGAGGLFGPLLCFHFIAASINGALIKRIFPYEINNNMFKYSLFAMLTIFFVSSVAINLLF